MERGGYIYIMTNRNHTTLYVGVTSGLYNRVSQHKTHFYPRSFSAKFNIHKLVYFESFPTIVEAIAREKQLKGGSRKKKVDLINSVNSEWRDLYEDIDVNY